MSTAAGPSARKTITPSFRCTPRLWGDFSAACNANGQSASAVLRRLIQVFLTTDRQQRGTTARPKGLEVHP